MWGLFLKRSEVPIFAPGHSTAFFHTNPFPLDPYLLPAALPFVLAFASWFLSSLFTFSLYPFPPDFSLPILFVLMTYVSFLFQVVAALSKKSKFDYLFEYIAVMMLLVKPDLHNISVCSTLLNRKKNLSKQDL